MKKLLTYTLLLLTVISCLQEERSPEEILVPSPAQVDCSEAFAITSKVPKGSEKLVEECGFLVGTAKDLADAVAVEGVMVENAFSAELPSRKYGSTYYICSYITNGHGSEIRSDVRQFEMKALDEYVEFDEVELVSYDAGKKQAEITLAAEIWEGVNVSEVGVCYGESEDLTVEGKRAKGKLSEDGVIFITLKNFTDAVQYYLRPYVMDDEYIAYGDVVPFLIPSVPVVKTYPAEEVTSTSVLLSGEVERGENITERGFVWLNGQGVPTVDSYKLKVDGGLGKYTASLTDLEANQKYAYRAYVINNQGTYYGDIVNFTTIAGLPSLSTTKVSEVTETSAIFSSKVTSEGGAAVTEVGFYYSTQEDVNLETAMKVSDDFSTDNFTLSVDGLEVGTVYYVMAYAVNSAGEGYNAIVNFKTTSTAPTVNTTGYNKLSATSAELSGEVTDDNGEDVYERGFVWMKGAGSPTTSSNKLRSEGELGAYTATLDGIEPNQTYSFRAYAINSVGTAYGEQMQLEIKVDLPTVATAEVTNISDYGAVCGGTISSDGGGEILAKGVVWSKSSNPTVDLDTKADEGKGSSSFTSNLTDLSSGRTYYVRAYATNAVGTAYGEEKQFTTTGEIQAKSLEPANSFIISSYDTYSFQTVKGNSSESVGSVASAEVLWESFGTDEQPEVGSLVSSASYENGKIVFETANPYREGNAVIAAKDASGTILWSWHIWLTDQPQEQIYNNNAGTMMDRNLGATSATPGDVGALGLLYQWGRKDPFLGGSSIDSIDIAAESTINWPSAVSSNSSNGTIAYATEHPTTFITYSNNDWYYTGSDSTDNTRWQSVKTIYDPCPVGWRVPYGGEDGVWSTAKGSSSSYTKSYDYTNKGMNFSGDFGNDAIIWYPASGSRGSNDGSLINVAASGYYWSYSPYPSNSNRTYDFRLYSDASVSLDSYASRACGRSVRCLKEGTGGDSQYDNDFSTSDARSLSDAETANSYIVSNSGTYSIPAVKGNSSESVGSVVSAEVLWETFGTDEKVFKGGLVSGAKYEGGKIYFKTADSYREGNAVIAAKDPSGTILWSWHIWLTDQPQEQVYHINAGTMMDRNLGATSATPGDVGTLGLMYQWGRKDPFLGSSSTSSNKQAVSTGAWAINSSGNREQSDANPMTFYTGINLPNDSWRMQKTVYDPCPPGWRIPDGGENGVWSTAKGSSSDFMRGCDVTNMGMNFSGDFGNDATIWYPASGYLGYDNGSLYNVSTDGNFWACSPNSGDNDYAYYLYFNATGDVVPVASTNRSYGFSVRCQKEGTGGGFSYNDDFSTLGATSLSDAGTANCYIVSGAGTYAISAVKGNSNQYIGNDVSMEVLWESFGTDETIHKGDLITGVKRGGDYIYFKTSDTFREGNAVIAAKDASGTILWSWHIWLTDQPQGQVYNNNAGTMMDRNLGATSATPGDVGALGLLYQWGRKDPFLGSSSISSSTEAKSTLTWPSAVSSDSSNGTIAYAVEHPTTFITCNGNNYDWHYTGSSSTDNTRWQSEKTIYDPCPSGWRVPDGGYNGVWNVAGFSSTTYDDTNKGISFSISSPSTTWYPASGCRYYTDGALSNVANYGSYWSVTPFSRYAYRLYFSPNGDVNPTNSSYLAYGFSVRCLQESE